MVLSDILSICLRIGELAFSAVVAGLNGEYLHQTRNSRDPRDFGDFGDSPGRHFRRDDKGMGMRGQDHLDDARKRFIYLEVVAALGILFSLLFLLPFTSSFIHSPVDFLTFVLFIVAFGLIAHYDNQCGSVWNWRGLTRGGACDKFKATLAFTFLAAIFFLASALLGCLVSGRKTRKGRVEGPATVQGRRKWYRRS